MSDLGVIGGVCTAHAPQLWTLPDSEDPELVGRLKTMLGGVGEKLMAMKPDIAIVIANDHASQFLLHCTASFTIHMGKVAAGAFAGREYSYPVASDASLALVRHGQRNGFDPGFTSNAEIDYAFAIPLDFTGIGSVSVRRAVALSRHRTVSRPGTRHRVRPAFHGYDGARRAALPAGAR